MSHGGIRKGAGRPKGGGTYKEATKPVRLPMSLIDSVLQFVEHKGYQLPLYSSKIQAGSPSSADEHIDKQVDLNQHLVKNPAATFLLRATGNSMLDAGIHQDDLLVIDSSLAAVSGKVVVAAVDGQLTVKRLLKTETGLFLMPENAAFAPIEVKQGSEVYIWGVVTSVIHAL
jgi:DNA polymerase V